MAVPRLPLLISVPHAGLRVPVEVRASCALTPEQLKEDGDEGAAEIYAFADSVEEHVTTSIARAIVDLTRAPDDRRKDGVVKTHTCWDVPVYREFPPEETVRALLAAHYDPYHSRLIALARAGLRLGVDCHTMAAIGPPVGPDPGAPRPRVCLSNGEGTCPGDWMTALKASFEEYFGHHVSINHPFKGGYITRTHAVEMPWVQVELSRAPYASHEQKRALVLGSLQAFLGRIG